ncbi:MAG TPA: TrpB-like pyridoxal phosphate-dependent enzyme [Thermoplasmata archaeon]|nr:TrpB-like pyridoxal phosphate-dependent enzyme [Thermoplasmata archaeon]
MSSPTRLLLDPEESPRSWYNLAADLPSPVPPPLHPATREPVGPPDLAPLFPMELIRQEISRDRFVRIPEPVHEAYALLNRPSPVQRAFHLERLLKTPARIYFKREDLSPTGSHKSNTAFAQAYYNLREGVEQLASETGAGQWGSALALACAHFGLRCRVFMVRASYDQKPYRKHVMNLYGADVAASPSPHTEYGARLLKENPHHAGSLGIAISEALEFTVKHPGTKYALGSVLNHVLIHQSVIGLELQRQLAAAEVVPDYMVGCVGGGSNFAGFAYPMIGESLRGHGAPTRFIAVEPTAVPSMTRGRYDYDFGDSAQMTPLLKMHTLGSQFVPSPIHAGGLRYHGLAPFLSVLIDRGIVLPMARGQAECFEAGRLFARSEGIVPAPESAHAIRVAIDLALDAKRARTAPTIVFNLSGHGLFDLARYAEYLAGGLAAEAPYRAPGAAAT